MRYTTVIAPGTRSDPTAEPHYSGTEHKPTKTQNIQSKPCWNFWGPLSFHIQCSFWYMVKIKHSNTQTNTTNYPNSLTLKHLPAPPKHGISITNPGGWWMEGSSPGKFSFALYTRFLRDVILMLHSTSNFRYFSQRKLSVQLITSRYCRKCKMQAGLYRLQFSSQRNTSLSHHLLILSFNKHY